MTGKRRKRCRHVLREMLASAGTARDSFQEKDCPGFLVLVAAKGHTPDPKPSLKKQSIPIFLSIHNICGACLYKHTASCKTDEERNNAAESVENVKYADDQREKT